MVKVNERHQERVISSSSRMKAVGADVARGVARAKKRHARVIVLEGDLGSGKTTFARGFVRELSGHARVLSPTFLLMKEYPLRQKDEKKQGVLYHFDWYRVSDPREVEALGWKRITEDPRNVILVEWPERAPLLVPADAVRICFAHAGAKERVVRIVSPRNA